MLENRRATSITYRSDAEPYAEDMTVSAHDVSAALRDRLPGLPRKKLHKLLYYCQGHHLATFGRPLFRETISAWDMGPVVGILWYQEKRGEVPAERSPLSEAELNTIGYVVSRYGSLSGLDLENLTHSEEPWQIANHVRRPRESARIELEWMAAYFRAFGVTDEDEDAELDSVAVTAWLQDAERRRAEPRSPDDPEEIRARLSAST
jgi:uncharacterized phage-associated protein